MADPPRASASTTKSPPRPAETISTAAVLTEHGIEAECLYFGTLTAKRFIAYLDVYVLALVVGGKLLLKHSSFTPVRLPLYVAKL